MTIETLQKRVDGKQKTVQKLLEKRERILLAKDSGWEKNPYCYNETDLLRVERELNREIEAREKYQEMLAEEEAKAASRNIKPILDFLDGWEERTVAFFIKKRQEYLVAKEEYYKKDKDFCQTYNDRFQVNLSKEEVKKLESSWRALRVTFQRDWNFIIRYESGTGSWEENMKKAVAKEKVAKYDDLVERVTCITGQITDASGIHLGKKGDLNGIIRGKSGNARIETIGAGGWNIQCYHFRTLVKRL